MMHARATKVSLLVAVAALAAWALPASAEMRSTKLDRHLCKTVGGGRFVAIPGFRGERIDRRLLPDIKWMRHRFHIFVTDGYSTDPIHAANGEHPIGLALDIVPDWAAGGDWGDIGKLAHLAEPRQNHPVPPYRWVGWNGDPGHGRGNHLHLSYMHSYTKPKDPARTVFTRICPGAKDKPRSKPRDHSPPTGGIGPGGGRNAGGGGGGSGGIGAGKLEMKLAPAVPERRE
jgi:hypothetical protein